MNSKDERVDALEAKLRDLENEQPVPVAPLTPVAPAHPVGPAPMEVPDSGRVSGNRSAIDGMSGQVGSRPVASLPAGMMNIAALLKVRLLADAAYTQQHQMGIDTEILMLPTGALYEAMGHVPPVVPHPDGESETFGEGSV